MQEMWTINIKMGKNVFMSSWLRSFFIYKIFRTSDNLLYFLYE